MPVEVEGLEILSDETRAGRDHHLDQDALVILQLRIVELELGFDLEPRLLLEIGQPAPVAAHEQHIAFGQRLGARRPDLFLPAQ